MGCGRAAATDPYFFIGTCHTSGNAGWGQHSVCCLANLQVTAQCLLLVGSLAGNTLRVDSEARFASCALTAVLVRKSLGVMPCELASDYPVLVTCRVARRYCTAGLAGAIARCDVLRTCK